MINLNEVQPSTSGSNELIPDNTIAPVRITVRGEKATKAGDARMLDCEFVVLEGPHARRRFWANMMITSNGSEGHNTAVRITMERIRKIVESAYGIDPNDKSESAMSARMIEDFIDIDGFEFVAKIGIEKGSQGYSDKNALKDAVTCDQSGYEGFQPVKPKTRGPSGNAPAAQTNGSRPEWAA